MLLLLLLSSRSYCRTRFITVYSTSGRLVNFSKSCLPLACGITFSVVFIPEYLVYMGTGRPMQLDYRFIDHRFESRQRHKIKVYLPAFSKVNSTPLFKTSSWVNGEPRPVPGPIVGGRTVWWKTLPTPFRIEWKDVAIILKVLSLCSASFSLMT